MTARNLLLFQVNFVASTFYGTKLILLDENYCLCSRFIVDVDFLNYV
jgi:hypothetical protein